MNSELLQKLQPLIVGGVFVLLYLAEHLYPQRRELIDYKHDGWNVLVGILNITVIFGVSYYFGRVLQWSNGAQFGLLYWLELPAWISGVLAFLFLDVLLYGWHRLNHRSGFLWRFHKFHHLDTKMNTTSAMRFHTVELLLSYGWRFTLIPLLGISVGAFVLYNLVFTAVVIFHHSGIRIGLRTDKVIRLFVVTPHLHRIHHSIVFEEMASNFSSVLRIWDQLFGTYKSAPKGDIVFGVPVHPKHSQKASPNTK